MLHRTLLRLACFVALSPALVPVLLQAQVEHGGRPPSLGRALQVPVPTARMQPVRADLLLAEDAAQAAASAGKAPLRFAEVLPVELSLVNAGAWEELERGARVWRLRIHSPGAKSLALVFARFHVPAGGELYVYDDRHEVVRGAYTEHENRLDGRFGMRPLRGEALTLEYYEPAEARGLGELVLESVAHDYRDVLSLLEPEDRAGGGTSDSCEIDVACPLGTNWQNAINATVHVQSLSLGLLCSGTLLNNTANDGSLLLLAAAHCGGLTEGVFTFNYERATCGTGTGPCTNTITGATQLVRDVDADIQLMRLNAAQGPLPYPVVLAGWDRSDVAPPSLVLVHHPAGDVKKISRDNTAPTRFNNFWRIRSWDAGVTEGGSSGGPMVDPAGRVIGILDSGSSSCRFPDDDDFATRLAPFWSLLEPYLDPLGTAALTTDALDLAATSAQPFAVTGVFPSVVEPLTPTPVRTQRILGTGFRGSAQVLVDGVPLDPSRYILGGYSFFNVDLPPTPIGAHTFSVLQDGNTLTVPFTVAMATEPRCQVGKGFVNEHIFSLLGVDTFSSDEVGHLHYCFWSLSNVPSIHPALTLGIGDNFTDLRWCRINRVPSEGFIKVHHPIAPFLLPIGTIVYNQVVCVSHGAPLRTSNLQQTEFRY